MDVPSTMEIETPALADEARPAEDGGSEAARAMPPAGDRPGEQRGALRFAFEPDAPDVFKTPEFLEESKLLIEEMMRHIQSQARPSAG